MRGIWVHFSTGRILLKTDHEFMKFRLVLYFRKNIKFLEKGSSNHGTEFNEL